MSLKSFVDKLAKKSFNLSAVKSSWDTHMQFFGPILGPAFEGDDVGRVNLTAALNLISNQKTNEGMKKIQSLFNRCRTDADKAALLFFTGVCFEMSGRQEEMVELYTSANEYEHNFYMPYIKVARYYLMHCMYDKAEENFRRAIVCFENKELTDQDRDILDAAYSNLASCLVMMHQYEAAENAVKESKRILPDSAKPYAAESMLFALRGETEEAYRCLGLLKEEAPDVYTNVKDNVDKILDHSSPLFYSVPIDEENIRFFWKWFISYEDELTQKLDSEAYEEAVTPIAEKLLYTFPFMEVQPYIAIGKDEEGFFFILHDIYAVSLMEAYEKLVNMRGDEVKYKFVILH